MATRQRTLPLCVCVCVSVHEYVYELGTHTMPKYKEVTRIIMKFLLLIRCNALTYSTSSYTDVHVHVHVLMRDERREEERSKQGQTNNNAKQHSTPKAVTFPKKN